AGRPQAEASHPEDRAAGRRGAGAPPSEASHPEDRAAGRRGAGAPPSEASHPEDRAAGRPWAGPRASEASHPAVAPAKPALEPDLPRARVLRYAPGGADASAEGRG